MSVRVSRSTESAVATYGIQEQPGTGLHSPADGQLSFLVAGSTDHLLDSTKHGLFTVELSITAIGNSTRGVSNPLGADLVLWRTVLQVVGTSATGTVDAGLAADISTSSDTTFDGTNVASAAVLDSENSTDKGTNGIGKPQIWGATQAFTATGNIGGTIGTIKYIMLCSRA